MRSTWNPFHGSFSKRIRQMTWGAVGLLAVAMMGPAVCPAQTSTNSLIEMGIEKTNPIIEVSHAAFDITIHEHQNALNHFFRIQNAGGGILSYSVASNQSWMTVWPPVGTSSGEEDEIVIGFQTTQLQQGQHVGTITISDPAAQNSPQTIQITLEVLAPSPCVQVPFLEDFESGFFGPQWTVSGTNNHRVQVTSDNNPYDGNYHVVMDNILDGGASSRNELTLCVNLEGKTNMWLGFLAKEFNDDPDGPPPSPFTNGADFDGVAISADGGTTWYEVQELRTSITPEYKAYAVNLDSVAAQHGISLTSNFKIRFNQFDNYPVPTDGIAIDTVIVGQFPVPFIETSVQRLDPVTTLGVSPPVDTFTIRNAGTQIMDYTLTDNVGWLVVSPNSGSSTGEEDLITVTYNTTSLPESTYNAVITINSPSAFLTRKDIPVTLSVNRPPTIYLNKSSISRTIKQTQIATPDTFTIRNSGSGELNYSITDDADWIEVTPTSGTSTGETDTITVSFPTAELQQGTYYGHITVSDPRATNNPRTITITMNVIQDDFVEIVKVGHDPVSMFPLITANILVDTVRGRDCLLDENDFTIKENNIVQTITLIECSGNNQPSGTDIVFVFDDTGSMTNEISGMKREATELAQILGALGIDAKFALVTFKDTVEFDLDLTDNVTEFQDAVNLLQASGGADLPEVALDAVAFAIQNLDYREQARKVYILITDATTHYRGDGTNYSQYTMPEVVAMLNQVGGTVFTVSPNYTKSNMTAIGNDGKEVNIALDEKSTPTDYDVRVLSDETGGVWTNITSDEFSGIADRIIDLLASYYTVTYVSSNIARDNSTRNVCATVTDSNKGTSTHCSSYKAPDGFPPSLLCLTEYTDVWISTLNNQILEEPSRMAFLGFQNRPGDNWKAAVADFNGDSYPDMATITPWSEMWIATGDAYLGFNPPTKQGLYYTENSSVGWTTLFGDFNNNGRPDALQLKENGDIWIGWNTNGTIPSPQYITGSGLRHNPLFGLHVLVADMNGDHRDDLVQLNNTSGTVSVCLSNGTSFNALNFWGAPQFKNDPGLQRGVHIGDFNHDGRDDLCEISWPKARVALSTGSSLGSATTWNATLGFRDDTTISNNPWWVFVADINGDNNDDLLQLNDIGEIWVARSNGTNAFLTPQKNAAIGFRHQPDGPWQVYVSE